MQAGERDTKVNRLMKSRGLVQRLRPIDDIFFRAIMKDRDTFQEMLRVVLGDEDLQIREMIGQEDIKNLYGRSVCLDALCVLGNGSTCNIEVQRADDDDHLRRARYHASCITANIAEPGKKFKHVPDVIVVYITEFDLFRGGKAMYHVHKVVEETGNRIDDGLTFIFANAQVDDGTTIAEYLQCMVMENVQNEKFPCLSKTVAQYKRYDREVVNVGSNARMIINEIAQEVAQDIAQDIAKDMAQGMAQDMAQGMAQDMAQSMAQDMAKDMAQKLVNMQIEQARERLNQLNQFLIRDERVGDLLRATQDMKFQEQLMEEYGIV